MNRQGLLAFVLHAHLPFVRHPEHKEFLEERWFFEAITETYLPLLSRLERLEHDKVPVRITMSVTPTLLAMLSDAILQSRYSRHLEKLIELAEKEIQRTRWEPKYQRLALLYHHRFIEAKRLFDDVYRRDLIRVIRGLSDRGILELIASCATHAVLPLLNTQPIAVRAQIQAGIEAFEQAFGRQPEGFWLPECGYYPGCDELLKDYGVRYFFLDAHGVLSGAPKPKYRTFAPVACPSGVFAFGRDAESTMSVCGQNQGYPSDFDYRDLDRDIGYDLDYEYLKPYMNGGGSRISTGIKYYRITGKTKNKLPYDPDRALEKAAVHAAHFIAQRKKQYMKLRTMDRDPIIVCPYDAQLLGHWWFEGPDWLDFIMRKLKGDQTFTLVTPSDYLARYRSSQRVEPSLSSWGPGGYFDVWLNGSNDWTYRHQHKITERMVELTARFPNAPPLEHRALNQMARELLLIQSSDWAFIMKHQTHSAYAYRRLQDHLGRFNSLYEGLCQGHVDALWLADIEAKDNIFPFLDYQLYAHNPASA